MNIFEQAIDLHARWKARLSRDVVTGVAVDVLDTGSCHACELGAWIYSRGLKYNNLASFEAMCSKHEQFHRAAAEVAMHGNAGRTARAVELLSHDGAFEQASLMLVELLRECGTELDLREEELFPIVTVGDVLRAKDDQRLYSVDAGAPIREALRTMVADQIGLLVIYKDRQFVGVFTERGFVHYISAQGSVSFDDPIETAIDRKLINVNRETSLDDCMELMFATHRGHAVVLGADEVEGIVGFADIISELRKNKTYPYRFDKDLSSATIPGFGNNHLEQERRRVRDTPEY